MVDPPPRKPKQSKAAALAYDLGPEDLPRVTAAGKGALAEKIVAMALAHGVKVREDADLAEILAALDVDSPIPSEVFPVVAEILAYVYRANGQVPPAMVPP